MNEQSHPQSHRDNFQFCETQSNIRLNSVKCSNFKNVLDWFAAKFSGSSNVIWCMDDETLDTKTNLFCREPLWIKQGSHNERRVVIPIGQMKSNVMSNFAFIFSVQRLRDCFLCCWNSYIKLVGTFSCEFAKDFQCFFFRLVFLFAQKG